MLSRLVLGFSLGALCAAPVLAQQNAPAYTADQFVAILKPTAKPRTRGLAPGAGLAAEGMPGSGVVPDLKVWFNFNSAELSPDSRATLDELGKALQSDELGGLRFEIGGHTDAKGSNRFNEELSRRRALAVTSYLEESFGIDARRLRSQGYGEERLADPQSPNSGINRRVEIRTIN